MIDLSYIVVIIISLGILYYITTYSYSFQLKCIVSDIDGNKYCVRDRKNETNKHAVELLASVVSKLKTFISKLKEKYPNDDRVQRMAENFNPNRVSETLPNSKYTAFSENKGQSTAFCLNTKKDNESSDLIDEHTLTFVAIHEIAHDGNATIGHGNDFWGFFKFLLEEAKEMGIHTPRDYSKEPIEYCDMKISDNPFFDM